MALACALGIGAGVVHEISGIDLNLAFIFRRVIFAFSKNTVLNISKANTNTRGISHRERKGLWNWWPCKLSPPVVCFSDLGIDYAAPKHDCTSDTTCLLASFVFYLSFNCVSTPAA
jgi:hypothetical protein